MSKKERLFWESRFSTMSSAKWFKLFTLLHQLKIPFPPLKKPIKIRWIWSNDNWNEPMSAGTLSRYILWEHTLLSTAINNYIKMFRLKKY